MSGNSASSGTPSAMELNKQSDSHSYSQSSTYMSYQPKSSSYQTQNYSSPSYSTTQVSERNYLQWADRRQAQSTVIHIELASNNYEQIYILRNYL